MHCGRDIFSEEFVLEIRIAPKFETLFSNILLNIFNHKRNLQNGDMKKKIIHKKVNASTVN